MVAEEAQTGTMNGTVPTEASESPSDTAAGPNQDGEFKELFHEEASQSKKPWWKTHFFVQDPVLFGTWDGVFTSCLINIFGVVLFLRTGWMVGNVGVGLSILIVFITVSVALLASLAAIGVCERLRDVHGGGVYFIVSYVLGGKIGGTVGVMYSFGLCIVSALYCTGFAESVTETFGWDNEWAVRGVAIVTLLLLLAINLAGVKWVIRLQLILLFVLIISTSDFIIGTMVHTDPDAGFVGFSAEVLHNNTGASYQDGEGFFSVFGVFFPTATGVMAGVNMSGDLKTPARSIPIGTLSALAISFIFYLLFVLLLGSTCLREYLKTDFMIAEKVSAVSFLWLAGVYMSSTSSCSTGLYGAPRVIQCIANENVVPAIKFLGKGFGANKTPILAIITAGLISLLFIFVGNLNAISPVITCNFMLVYAVVDYSYFALAMTYDLRMKNLGKYTVKYTKSDKKVALHKSSTYGSIHDVPVGTMHEFSQDLDKILQGAVQSNTSDGETTDGEKVVLPQTIGEDTAPKSGRQYLQQSFLLDSQMNASEGDPPTDSTGPGEVPADAVVNPFESPEEAQPELSSDASGGDNVQVIFSATSPSAPNEEYADQNRNVPLPAQTDIRLTDDSYNTNTTADDANLIETKKKKKRKKKKKKTAPIDYEPKEETDFEEILQQPRSWYGYLCNRWSSLFGVVLSLVVMFLIKWLYALMNILAFALVYIYISQANPGVNPGVTHEFRFFEWLKESARNCCRSTPPRAEQIILPPPMSAPLLIPEQLTSDNEDFAYRGRFHQASTGDYNYATFAPVTSPMPGN